MNPLRPLGPLACGIAVALTIFAFKAFAPDGPTMQPRHHETPLWHAKVLRETANELETRAGGRYGR